MVCVDYSDLLALTLPYNRHHFSEVCVVSSFADRDTRDFCLSMGVKLFLTDSFYERGARFNKWLALEEGLDFFGRDGWLAIMDADVLWPNSLKVFSFVQPGIELPDERDLRLSLDMGGRAPLILKQGQLCSPLRRMHPTVPLLPPEESTWGQYPLHRNQKEWVGFTQIFHASDPVLGPPPWHQVDWTHAGGADSFFQKKWPQHKKVRPPFEVLHLGPAGTNWCGRASSYVDGTTPEEAAGRRAELERMMAERKVRRNYQGEKLPP